MTAAAVAGRHAAPGRRSRARRSGTLGTVVMLLAVTVAAVVGAGRIMGVRPLVEQSGSMEPVISPGDLVVSRTIRAADARPGDIVSFRDATRGGALITHRVAGVRRIGDTLAFETRGDANSTSERWTSAPDAELGRSLFVAPYAGHLAGAVTQPLAAGSLAGLAALLAVLAIAGRIRRGRPAR